MSRNDSPPFARGETYYNGETIDTNNLGGTNLEGREYLFEVNAPDDTSQTDPSGRQIRVRVVRNKSSINLKGARLATTRLNADSPLGTATDGYTFAEGDPVLGVIDEFLPAAGVPPNDLFYVVLDGPTKMTSADASFLGVAPGDRIVPAAGTSKVTADAGKVNKIQTTPVVADVFATLGRADSTLISTAVGTAFKVVARRLPD